MIAKRSKEESLADALVQIMFHSGHYAALVTRVCDGTILNANDEFFRITGFSREEVIGKSIMELNVYFDPKDRTPYLCKISESGVLENEHVALRRRDGSKFTAIVSARSFRSEDYEYVCWTIRDMSEKIQKEREHYMRDEELRRLFDTMAQGIGYLDKNGRIIFANPAAERMLGLSVKQMVQRTPMTLEWNIIREDGTPLPVSEHPAMIALRTKKPFGPFTLGVFNESVSDYIWLSVYATPLFHEGEDEPYQVYVMLTDITAEIKARQDYQKLFDEMLDGFALHEIICDESGHPVDYRYISVNPAFERLTGLKACDVVGKTVMEVLPETEPYWINYFGQVALTGVPVSFHNYSVAIDKYFNVTAYRPAPMQFACICSDQTQQVHAQKEKEKAQEQIRQLAHICDVAPSCIVIFSLTGKILYAN